MTDRRYLNEAELEDLFAAARGASEVPGDALMERIMRDSVGEMPRPEAGTVQPRGRLSNALRLIGGWPAAAGLAAATIAGVSIGFGTPEVLDTLSGGYFLADGGATYDLDDLLPSYGDLLGEG